MCTMCSSHKSFRMLPRPTSRAQAPLLPGRRSNCPISTSALSWNVLEQRQSLQAGEEAQAVEHHEGGEHGEELAWHAALGFPHVASAVEATCEEIDHSND